jgi:hypothetical protein
MELHDGQVAIDWTIIERFWFTVYSDPVYGFSPNQAPSLQLLWVLFHTWPRVNRTQVLISATRYDSNEELASLFSGDGGHEVLKKDMVTVTNALQALYKRNMLRHVKLGNRRALGFTAEYIAHIKKRCASISTAQRHNAANISTVQRHNAANFTPFQRHNAVNNSTGLSGRVPDTAQNDAAKTAMIPQGEVAGDHIYRGRRIIEDEDRHRIPITNLEELNSENPAKSSSSVKSQQGKTLDQPQPIAVRPQPVGPLSGSQNRPLSLRAQSKRAYLRIAPDKHSGANEGLPGPYVDAVPQPWRDGIFSTVTEIVEQLGRGMELLTWLDELLSKESIKTICQGIGGEAQDWEMFLNDHLRAQFGLEPLKKKMTP